MEIYLIPSHKGYELFSPEVVNEEPEGKGLVRKVKRFYEKFVSNQEKVLREAGRACNDLVLYYSSDIPEPWGKNIYKNMIKKEKIKNVAYFATNFVLAPVTFVVAPFLPFVNWGLAFFFAYKCVTNYKAMHGIKKIENASGYRPSADLSELENVLIKCKDYAELTKKAEELGWESLAKFYSKRQHKKIKKVKIA